jgi:hypothetical protein
MAAYLDANKTVNVEIVGHTDNQGTADGNLDLSKRRAAAVAHVLTEEFKIAAERFKTDGMGDTKPIASNDGAEGRAMNRRVSSASRRAASQGACGADRQPVAARSRVTPDELVLACTTMSLAKGDAARRASCIWPGGVRMDSSSSSRRGVRRASHHRPVAARRLGERAHR